MKIWTDQNYPIIISCAKELSHWTGIEVREMGYIPIEITENTVVVRGAMRDVMKLREGILTITEDRTVLPISSQLSRNMTDMAVGIAVHIRILTFQATVLPIR